MQFEKRNKFRRAVGTGVEPVIPYENWFSKPTRYRPAHPPCFVHPARIELTSKAPQASTLSVELRVRIRLATVAKPTTFLRSKVVIR
jgi:hypothetical protein